MVQISLFFLILFTTNLQIGFVCQVNGTSRIQVYASEGKLVLEKHENAVANEIRYVNLDCEGLPKGYYLIKIINPDDVTSTKFVKL
ncbi:MAG: T9SS type A sorting domain-containing protein [Bacteroidetes bacterium]|nr:T9SS type A sorting domain-containing protein [Bacteroidota bacterium]